MSDTDPLAPFRERARLRYCARARLRPWDAPKLLPYNLGLEVGLAGENFESPYAPGSVAEARYLCGRANGYQQYLKG